jgi:aerobic-type carbon monoxide dehydrogenase small subunit (CoxS/CutS family)
VRVLHPEFIIASADVLARIPDPDAESIRSELSGNLCRRTAYTNIVKAVRTASRLLREERGDRDLQSLNFA